MSEDRVAPEERTQTTKWVPSRTTHRLPSVTASVPTDALATVGLRGAQLW
jgi:hypothetical protein